MTRIGRRATWRVLPLLLPLLAGCGEGVIVSGTVTYEGKPVAKGFITFYPAEGPGPTQGTEIVGGQYRLSNFQPGKKRVLIVSEPVARKVPAEHGSYQVKLQPAEDAVPASAVGNSAVHEVADSQTLDFHLTRRR
jgi:hypothetical protein